MWLDIRIWYKETTEKISMKIAWMLPKSIVRWVLVKCAVSVKNAEYPGQVTYEQMYKAI